MKHGFYGYRGIDPRAGRTPAGAPVASTSMMSLVSHAVAANDVPAGAAPISGGAAAATEESWLEKLGPWLWIAPAGVVAIALTAYFVKRKSLGGYRRRRRSRR